jgi:RNA methyltransferase, TrmH family
MAADEANDQRSLDTGPTFSLIRSLIADRRVRDASGCIFVEGIRNFITALDHGWSVQTIVYSERLLIAPVARKWVRRLKRADTPYCRVTPEQFRSISGAQRASGIGAILRQKIVGLDQVSVRDRACWMAVGEIRTAGNLGTLMRTAYAAGAAGFFFLGDVTDVFHPLAVRASMGAIFGLPLVRTNVTNLRRWTQRHGVQVIGASPDGDVPFNRTHYDARVLLMIGEERRGLTAEQRTLCDQLVHIPMHDNLDSLNAAVAGSLLLYEVLRPPASRG